MLLSALLDAAFDGGLVTFEDDGTPPFAETLGAEARTLLHWKDRFQSESSALICLLVARLDRMHRGNSDRLQAVGLSNSFAAVLACASKISAHVKGQ